MSGITHANGWVRVIDSLPHQSELVTVFAAEEYDVAYHDGKKWLGHAMSNEPTHWCEIPEGPSWRRV